MRKFLNLTKRNCLVFLRDRSAVFFSLLSMLIVLMLMGVFLANMNVESVTGLLEQYGGIRDAALDKENAGHLVQYWTLAGILVVNSLTVTLTVIGTMISDAHEHRLESFYAAPIKKSVIGLSYITSAILIGTLFCLLTFFGAVIYIVITGGSMLSAEAVGKIILYTFINVCVFAIILYFVALFIKSSSAWSGIATVVGTLVGFVGAIYLPMGELPEKVGNILKYIPILHGTSLMRRVCCEDMLEKTFTGVPQEVVDIYNEHMGITVIMNDKIVSTGTQLLFMVGCGCIAFLLILFVSKRKHLSR
ncbi:MAG: ABC transporter permease [Lachnospiraceae bacterium]|uniref:ABC transporter permease n=1 Tax=Roseburia hominis TaxID=301301 RepID=UPI001F171D73|nr:ABC transporter permease [Roseburia hominis]MCI5712922.1 ABC transporter permease [Lachnospiraceae bacterium]MDD6169146.1 ABC transporter permease [Lachnospiraceae bacterium]MDY4839750.1 ABC transporter permease [Lachnospiraceae bacterium]MEE1251255.1 ABC transporter permease [Lachnospiraceae bacterium]